MHFTVSHLLDFAQSQGARVFKVLLRAPPVRTSIVDVRFKTAAAFCSLFVVIVIANTLRVSA